MASSALLMASAQLLGELGSQLEVARAIVGLVEDVELFANQPNAGVLYRQVFLLISPLYLLGFLSS